MLSTHTPKAEYRTGSLQPRVFIRADSTTANPLLYAPGNQHYCQDIVRIAGSAVCYEKARHTYKPEEVFLDPETKSYPSGVDILHSFTKHKERSKIIHLTDSTRHAGLVVHNSADNNLTEPVDLSNVQSLVKKAAVIVQHEGRKNRPKKMSDTHIFRRTIPEQKILLRSHGNYYPVELRKVLYCESQHKYTIFHIEQQEPIKVRTNLSDYEDFLCQHEFMRVSRSYIINQKYISRLSCSYTPSTPDLLILIGNISIKIPKHQHHSIIRLLQEKAST